LLRRESDLRSDLAGNPFVSSAGAAELPRLTQAWITAGRPEVLGRSIESFLTQGLAAPDGIRVYHDRSDSERVEASHARVAEASERAGVPIEFLAEEERQTFARKLVEAVGGRVSRRVIDRALWAFTPATAGVFPTGAMRNWFLLTSRNRIAVSSDDDVFAPFLRAGESDGWPLISGEPDPLGVRFFENPTEIEQSGTPAEVSLELHRSSLSRGSRVGESGLAEAGFEALGPRDAELMGALRPVVPAAGVAGDSGMSRPFFRLMLQGADREDFVAEEARFEKLLHSRYLLRHAPRPTYSTRTQLMTPHVAFDTRLPLVPFPSNARADDGVFRSVLALVHPEYTVLHLPFTVQHAPPSPRKIPEDAYRDIAPRIHELLVSVLREIGLEAHPPRGHRAVGLRLASIAAQTETAFRRNVEQAWISAMADYVRKGDALLEGHDFRPEYWAEALETHLNAVVDFLSDGRIVPRDYQGVSEQEAWRLFQRSLEDYAELIAEWPAMCDAAGELGSETDASAEPACF
jgi:hypothetical protein